MGGRPRGRIPSQLGTLVELKNDHTPHGLTPSIGLFFVTLICRMLHTLETGEIQSKKAGTKWAIQTLPDQWHALITRATTTWNHQQETWHNKPEALEVAATLDFMRFALDVCAPGWR